MVFVNKLQHTALYVCLSEMPLLKDAMISPTGGEIVPSEVQVMPLVVAVGTLASTFLGLFFFLLYFLLGQILFFQKGLP